LVRESVSTRPSAFSNSIFLTRGSFAAASGEAAARNAVMGGKPLSHVLDSQCVAPWVSSASSSLCGGKPCSAGACAYVKRHCPQRSGLFNYLAIPYCSMPLMPGLATFMLMLWVVILSVWLAMAADAFLCPNLTVVSKVRIRGNPPQWVSALVM